MQEDDKVKEKDEKEKVNFVFLISVLMKVKVTPELIQENANTISDGKGGRIFL